jgi:hypothetical protein
MGDKGSAFCEDLARHMVLLHICTAPNKNRQMRGGTTRGYCLHLAGPPATGHQQRQGTRCHLGNKIEEGMSDKGQPLREALPNTFV